MKINIISFILLLLLVGCTATELSENVIGKLNSNNIQGVKVFVPPYEYGDEASSTRVNLTTTESGLTFSWTNGDEIGVIGETKDEYGDTKYQLTNQTLSNIKEGGLWAEFNGGAFTLSANSQYFSFYPYAADNTLGKSQRNMTFAGQKQNGNNNTAHIGKYNYMVAPKVTTNASGSCSFYFDNCCCPCRFTLTLPESAQSKTISKMTVTRYVDADFKFATKVCQDLKDINTWQNAETVASGYNNEVKTQNVSQTLEFENCIVGVDFKLVAWEMFYPNTHTTERYHIAVTCSDNTVYTGEVAGKLMAGGKAYRFTATLSDYQAIADGVNLSVRNEGATSPYDVGTLSTSAPAEINLPTEEQIQKLLDTNTFDRYLGSGHKSDGTLVYGIYFKHKTNGSIIFLPATLDGGGDSHFGYYWLSGGTRYIYFDTANLNSIVVNDVPSAGGISAASRTIKQ